MRGFPRRLGFGLSRTYRSRANRAIRLENARVSRVFGGFASGSSASRISKIREDKSFLAVNPAGGAVSLEVQGHRYCPRFSIRGIISPGPICPLREPRFWAHPSLKSREGSGSAATLRRHPPCRAACRPPHRQKALPPRGVILATLSPAGIAPDRGSGRRQGGQLTGAPLPCLEVSPLAGR